MPDRFPYMEPELGNTGSVSCRDRIWVLPLQTSAAQYIVNGTAPLLDPIMLVQWDPVLPHVSDNHCVQCAYFLFTWVLPRVSWFCCLCLDAMFSAVCSPRITCLAPSVVGFDEEWEFFVS